MNQDTVYTLLKNIYDPKTGQPLAQSGRIQDFYSDDHRLMFSLSIDLKEEKAFKELQKTCTSILENHFLGKVLISLTHHKQDPLKAKVQMLSFPSIKHIIAISSGKGGVGKSTVALNVALSVHALGYKVGLLDGDIYGPSLPMLVNHTQKPPLNEKGEMIPFEKFGLKMNSIGFLLEAQSPVLWRGPMAQSSFQKLLTGTAWEDLDFLFIDLPPGTGDIHLTMAQKIPLRGAVIVSTPQDLALIDAFKALKMFQTLNVPLLGLIENMSYVQCPNCHHTIDIFGQGGTESMISKENLHFLGALPLTIELRQACDNGVPLHGTDPNHFLVNAFKSIAEKLIKSVEAASCP